MEENKDLDFKSLFSMEDRSGEEEDRRKDKHKTTYSGIYAPTEGGWDRGWVIEEMVANER